MLVDLKERFSVSKESYIRDYLFLAIQKKEDFTTMTRGRLIELTGNQDVTPEDIQSGKVFLLNTAEIIRMAQRLNVKVSKEFITLF